ncbi:hypothetical protein BAUCODRAFT_33723 [Baudoinia panamericana UAMH 10762]|uniref:Uncharacterized protein n=1 Tax=Baudoinia panamericana (strain UAMH 10762) TaxID=717646 RepID=M2MI99_BAUPA|nr:uncharacterized protein BAUCODRAFT_33723 [Baudoinia panamericana UAMH 10762]EMC96396.1 hypothetical protein BAUCODRAFT_33723 [Baudoinia panamericana UAMH 10762]
MSRADALVPFGLYLYGSLLHSFADTVGGLVPTARTSDNHAMTVNDAPSLTLAATAGMKYDL